MKSLRFQHKTCFAPETTGRCWRAVWTACATKPRRTGQGQTALRAVLGAAGGSECSCLQLHGSEQELCSIGWPDRRGWGSSKHCRQKRPSLQVLSCTSRSYEEQEEEGRGRCESSSKGRSLRSCRALRALEKVLPGRICLK